MPTIDVYNMEGKVCGTLELSDKVFAAQVNGPVIHSVVRAYLLNQRQGTQSTLTRSEVAGGGRKPCQTGFDPRAAVDEGRHRARPEAQKLQSFRE